MKKFILPILIITVAALITYALIAYKLNLQIIAGCILLIVSVYICFKISGYKTLRSENSL